ncbi:MAG: hypothetical protein L0G99_00820 [Propionibacteriales bacterium]|nr:hypothetical protein [Propionibacteriales bacterium]
MIQRTGGDLGKVETKLGLDAGTLTDGDTLIAWVEPNSLKNLRMPDGNELDANDLWEPGGYTSGGLPEATIDVPAGSEYRPTTV